MQIPKREDVSRKVMDFYNAVPFNFSSDVSHFSESIRGRNPIEISYPNLHAIFLESPGHTVLEIGCGTGWFANSVAFHYGVPVVAVDISQSALERAKEISKALGIEDKIRFVYSDVFDYEDPAVYSIVNSIGVLHHTFDCETALKSIERFVTPGGYLHIGLYHKYGREPFLSLFEKFKCKDRDNGEMDKKNQYSAFQLFKDLNRNISDDTMLWSWFRDQVLHPHESQHTLREVYQWIEPLGYDILSTSLNTFQPISSLDSLFEMEKTFTAISIEKNRKKREYYPGFFTCLAGKRRV